MQIFKLVSAKGIRGRFLNMDIVDPKTRSRMMRGITSKDTKPETLVRSYLHRRGFRYRLHHRIAGSRPDLVFAQHKAVVFVHGCFWHRHAGCRFAYMPKSRKEFWKVKLSRNAARDVETLLKLTKAGWRTAVVWECVLRSEAQRLPMLEQLADWISGTQSALELPESSGSVCTEFFRQNV